MMLVEQHGHDWRTIGSMMNRTAIASKNHYYNAMERASKANLKIGHWTVQEDEDLLQAIRDVTGQDDLTIFCKNSTVIPWPQVAAVMPARYRDQCWHRW